MINPTISIDYGIGLHPRSLRPTLRHRLAPWLDIAGCFTLVAGIMTALTLATIYGLDKGVR